MNDKNAIESTAREEERFRTNWSAYAAGSEDVADDLQKAKTPSATSAKTATTRKEKYGPSMMED